MLHCKGPGEHTYEQCLRGTNLILTGDSTTRKWYKVLMEQFNCLQVTEKWTTTNWPKRSVCVSTSNNFTLEWCPHALPLFIHTNFDNIYSIASILDNIKNNTKVVIVINLYLHLLAYHHSVFQNRIRVISKSVANLLQRNVMAEVLVKGFTTFSESPGARFKRFDDYFRHVYKDITYKEFSGLHNKVVYMDQKDMTIAKKMADMHPPVDDVRESIYQMLDYICS